MRPEVMTLFRQVAELPQAERADHYARQQVPDDVRREVESLLQFDWTNEPLRDASGSAAPASIDASSADTGSPAAANRTLSTPERIGRFEVERLIGRGGMGQVYLARDPVIGRRVAIKLIASGVENETARRRLVREARTAGRLRHPNIVTVFEAGEHQDQPFIAMEFVPGRTLRSLIAGRAPLSLRRRLEMVEGACAGLAHAHREGVVHLDIKPDNLILDESGVVKVLDFGISRSSADTLTVHVAGTLRYMSPEQIHGKELDPRSDTFSLGCALFELIAYEPAFSGSTSEIVTQIAYGPVPRLADSVPGVHPELERIVGRAMSIEASERYADLEELRGELARVRLSIDPAADQPAAPPERSGPVERPPSRIPRSSAPVSTWRPTPLSMAAVVGAVTVIAAGVGLSIRGELRGPGRTAPEPVVPAAPPAAAAPSVSTPSPATDDVWRLLARGERAAVLARLDAAPDAALARAVVDTVRATVLRSRQAASAGAGTTTYRNGEAEMTRATTLAAGGRMTDALRALWQAGDLYAKTSLAPAAATAPAPAAAQTSAGAAPVTAGPPAALATPPPLEPAVNPPAPQPASTTSIPAAVPERPAVTAVPAPAPTPPAPVPARTDAQAVIEVLRRYDAAYEALDIAAVQRVFPSLGREQVDILRRTFEGVTRYEKNTRAGRVDVAGDTATVQATVTSRIAPRVGNQYADESDMVLRLRRAGNDWVIVSVTPR
jgi:serine/threonine-protein kinase